MYEQQNSTAKYWNVYIHATMHPKGATQATSSDNF